MEKKQQLVGLLFFPLSFIKICWMLCRHVVCIFWLLLCFLLWQRVVKADIVNYSQEPVTRTVNPPRSSMCAVQWPRCSPLVWYLCSPALSQALGSPGALLYRDQCNDAIRGFRNMLHHCPFRSSRQFFAWLKFKHD